MHMMAQISFFFLLQTVEDGDNEETPVQEPQPEDWQRKENVCYLTKDSDSQRPSGEEQSSVSAARLNWLCVCSVVHNLFLFCASGQDEEGEGEERDGQFCSYLQVWG